MGRLFWITWEEFKCNNKCPYKKEAKRNLMTVTRGKGNVTTEAEIGMVWPQAKKCWQPSLAFFSKGS